MTVYNLKDRRAGGVTNVTMMFNGAQNEKVAFATDVGSIPLAHIKPVDPAKRLRPLDRNNVDQLKVDIATRGLLQPIGVRSTKGDRGGPYELVYGYHRLKAMEELLEADETNGKVASASIPAVIYPERMTDNECKAAECVENLLRKELSEAEKGAHGAVYLGLMKSVGALATTNERNAENGKKGGKSRPKDSAVKSLDSAMPKKPTAVEALQAVSQVSSRAKEGAKTSRQTIINRFNAAKDVAGVHSDKTLETATAEELVEIGEAALRNMPKHKAKTEARNSQAGKDRSKRVAETPDSRLEAQIRGHVAVYGWDKLKKAVQTVWREDHAPEGRVVFNTTCGPDSDK